VLSRRRYASIKRVLDVTICLVLLPLVVPIILFCGALVWIESRGSLFYMQPRTGLHGKNFKMFKLRTMIKGADRLKHLLEQENRLSWPDFKVVDDPRVTLVGRFLRRSSIDELPQIFNVLRGEMSLVGPRPTSFDPTTYSLWQTERLEVLPGMTGLWQIGGRSNVEFVDRVRLDVEYVHRQSLATDLAILLRTPSAVLRRRGAY